MQYTSLTLYKPTDSVLFPNISSSGKNIVLSVLSENLSFLDTIKTLNIPFAKIKIAFVPSFKKPLRFALTSDYMKNILALGLKPARGLFTDIENLEGKNFYIDLNTPWEFFASKIKLKNYNNPISAKLTDIILSEYSNIDSATTENCLMYTVNVDDPAMEIQADSNTFKTRKVFNIFRKLYADGSLPFDKVILHAYSKTKGSKYILIYDKMAKLNFDRFKFFVRNPNLHKLKIEEQQPEQTKVLEHVINTIVRQLLG